MLRDNLVGLIEPMRISAGVDPPALIQKQSSDDRSSCLENPRPEGAESSLTENVTSPFQAEPAHLLEHSFVVWSSSWCGSIAAPELGHPLSHTNRQPPQSDDFDLHVFFNATVSLGRFQTSS